MQFLLGFYLNTPIDPRINFPWISILTFGRWIHPAQYFEMPWRPHDWLLQNGNPWMNTQKLFGFDTDKCLKHCAGNASNTTCDRRSFQLPQFCPNATEDCIKEQELCGCWRLVQMRAIGLFAARIRGSALLGFALRSKGRTCQMLVLAWLRYWRPYI